MTTLHIDFETCSEADLPSVGLDNYAKHPSTGVHCMGFAFGDDEVSLIADMGSALTDCRELFAHVESGGEVVAHNAPFELAVWNSVCVPKYGWPSLKPEQMRCTMAQCYAMGLPASLEKAAVAIGIEETKDVAGSRIMMQLARPKHDGSLWVFTDNPDKFNRLYDYCRQDVEVERQLDKRLTQLSEREREVWLLDRRINARGVRVDINAINQAIWLVNAEKQRLDGEMLWVTDGAVARCTEAQALVKWARGQGVAIDSVSKSDILDALNSETALPKNVREALNIRREAAKSSTAKLAAMRDRACRVTHRVRDSFQYHGATTGRWAHRGVQPGNLPRPRPDIKQDHIEDILKNLGDRDYIDINYGPVMSAMADCVRGMITAGPKKHLIAVDFSAVEARVLAWLAGEEKVLDIFRTHGKIYEHAAAGIYGKPIGDVTKDERQIGKVAVLALGFGGGVGAFQSMARVYGVNVDDKRAEEIKVKWRLAHPKIVQYWRELETAAIDAIDLDTVTFAGAPGREVSFELVGDFLWCRLPSGRRLCYPYPVVRQAPTPWGDTRSALYYHAVSLGNHWEETSTYGGSLAENVTQAVARDLLAEAMLRLEAAGYEIVMHVHDEIVAEVDEAAPADTLKKVEKIVATPPSWAKDLPLAAEGWRGFRYRK